MSSKLPGLVNPNDVYTEEVLKCIKDTIKQKSGQLTCKFDSSKAFMRNDETYVTEIVDKNKAWSEKFNRRKRNLHYGFFSDKAKPYQPLGKVYLESGDLIFHSLTDDLKYKIVRTPVKYNAKWSKPGRAKKTAPLQKAAMCDRPVEKVDQTEATAGFAAIKQRLNEVRLMRKGVHAAQSLSGYLTKKESVVEVIRKEEMRAPVKNQWKIVRAVGKIMGAVRYKDSPPGTQVNTNILSKAFKKKGKGMAFTNQRMGTDLEEMEDQEEKLQRYRREKRQQYLQKKLQVINSLLCSLHNIKSKMLKQQLPLPYRTVLELLRQDITVDQYGKPVSCRTNFVSDDASMFSDGSNADDSQSKPTSASSNVAAIGLTRKRMSSVAFSGTTRRPRLAQLASKFATTRGNESPTVKIDTWEDLLVAGERNKKSLKSAGQSSNKYSLKRRRDTTTTPGSNESLPPWCTIPQAEKVIQEKRRMAQLGNNTRRTAEDVLDDLKHDFNKMQKKMSKDVEDNLTKRKSEQYKLIHTKFNTMTLGPITSIALEKMRNDAYVLTHDRNDVSTQPMKWFSDLKDEVYSDSSIKDETINCLLKKIARFQYEDGKNIPFGKEKLCLIVMSMPAHLLMTANMLHALLFLLAKFLEAAPELLEFWLTTRKLACIKDVETSSTPKAPNYFAKTGN